ncbi:MAG: rhomboid family intramembrane serine protease [Burkholderiales bacterium PBB5]|nr:MAG: rhomboid family intramembrane serine protease [Burkholderiales bacterium PBB5]
MPSLPPVTKALMLICTAVYCIQLLLPILPMEALFALWPLSSGRFWPWQVLSYGLLHGSMGHLLFNMLSLWMFGGDLERLWGQKRYLQLIAASAFSAAVAQLAMAALMGSVAYTVGASGATYGLLLAFGLVFPNRMFDLIGLLPALLMMMPSETLNLVGMVLFFVMFTNRAALPFLQPVPIRAPYMVAIFGGLELIQGLFFSRSGVAHFAHLGGMLGAWLMLLWWRGRLPFGGKPGQRRR